MAKKKTTISFSYESIDEAIKKLRKLKKDGYTSIDGVSCNCWHSMCSADEGFCCFTGCCCGTFEIS